MQISRILRASWKSYKFFYCVPPTATLNRDIFVKENFVVSSFAREIMPDSCTESIDVRDVDGRRKKQRFSTSKIWQSTSTPNQRTLELEGVIEVLKEYDSCEGNDINCSICGKLYKSKVCFTKHLWEHSVYWDLFDALKNQERVLSIQAAIILSQPYLEFLLVTSPTSTEKKREDMKQPSGVRKPSLARKRRRESECSVDF